MNTSHFQGKLIALALALTVTSAVCSQAQPPLPRTESQAPPPPDNSICKIYQLRDVSDSADVRAWVQETIPQMVQPGTWVFQAAPAVGSSNLPRVGTITYDPKSGLMALRHTPAAHAEVDDFLKKVKGTAKELPPERKAAARAGQVMPAQFGGVETAKADSGNQGGYPIPSPQQQPKHLFHFVIRFEGSGMETALVDLAKKLAAGDATDTKDAGKDDGKAPLNQLLHFIVRYEGEGIIDSNVVEFMKVYARMANQEKDRTGADPLVGEMSPTGPLPRGAIDASQKRPASTYAVPMPQGGSGFGYTNPMPPSAPPVKVPAGVNLSNIEESRVAPAEAKPATAPPRILQVGTQTGGVDAQTTKNQSLSLEDVVRMTRSGVTAQIIINQINATGSTYSLSAEQIGWLTVQGVAGAVIEHMQCGGPHTSPMGPRPPSVETPSPVPNY